MAGIVGSLNKVVIRNNYIDSCFIGICSPDNNDTISYNKIVNLYAVGATGIELSGGDGIEEISHNKIIMSKGNGIQLIGCTESVPIDIFDNMISAGLVGIFCNRSNYTNIEFNNIAADSVPLVLFDAIYTYPPSWSTYNIIDNAMQNPNGGLLVSTYWLLDSGGSVYFNYNTYNSNGKDTVFYDDDNNTYKRITFSTWQSTGRDYSSMLVNPDFISFTDLHATNDTLETAGIGIPGITDDIDGNIRPNPPTIGANQIPDKFGIQPPGHKKTSITLYPNPASTSITIESSTSLINSITIFDATGKQMYQIGNLKTLSQDVQVNSLPSGIYFIKLGTDNGSYEGKFMKE